ncbi:MAG: chemotaxis protein CheB [Flavobacteriales bacterium]
MPSHSGQSGSVQGAVVIGASAGGIGALTELLPRLPATFDKPVLVVVHLPPRGRSAVADLFAAQCAVEVKDAEDKEPLRPGVVYFAPPDHHLLVEPDLHASLSRDEAVVYSRPSIDVLFTSAADAFGDDLTGIILTGANGDGAEGLHAVMEAGGTGWVQDPATAEADAMPKAALQACPRALSLSLGEMVRCLCEGPKTIRPW